MIGRNELKIHESQLVEDKTSARETDPTNPNNARKLSMVHTTLQILCALRQTVVFLQGDRKFSISVALQSTATIAVTCD